jgi:uncharacterized protein (TIGR02246 family)
MSVAETRNQQGPPDVVAAVQAIMEHLGRAWNSADGAAYAEPFSPGADFVTIRGDLHTGRDAIAAGHQEIFGTIYAGSTMAYRLLQARELDDRVVLAHVRAALSAPSGPLAGEHASTITAILLKHDDGLEITALHNTLLTE